MPNSIAGNVGVAGATVVAYSFSANQAVSVTADGLGNYTIPGLNPGLFYVVPSTPGFNFSPYSSKQTIVASNLTNVNFVQIAFVPTGVWTKQGDRLNLLQPVNTGTIFPGTQPITMMREAGGQLVAGTVFKLWYMDGNSMYYGESKDCVNWTSTACVGLTGYGYGQVFKNAGTFYMYPSLSASTQAIASCTSSDGIHWTIQNANAIGIGGVGTWDHSSVYQINVVQVISGNWTGLYTALGVAGADGILCTGICTSTDGVNWTKDTVNSPVIVGGGTPNTIIKIGSIFYTWMNYTEPYTAGLINAGPIAIPCDIYRIQSTDLINWTNMIPSLPRTLPTEGAQIGGGQCASFCIIPLGNITYAAYMGTPNGNGVGAQPYESLLATATLPIASIVASNEGVLASPQVAIDMAQRANENPLSNGGNWAALTGTGEFGALQLLSNLIQPISAATWGMSVWTGAGIGNDHYSEGILNASTDPGGAYLYLGVRMFSGASGWNGYGLQITSVNHALGTSQTVGLYSALNGVGTLIGSFTTTPKRYDIWRLQVSGTTLTVYQNGKLQLTVTDTTYATGKPGLFAYNQTTVANSSFIGWSAGNSAPLPLPAVPGAGEDLGPGYDFTFRM